MFWRSLRLSLSSLSHFFTSNCGFLAWSLLSMTWFSREILISSRLRTAIFRLFWFFFVGGLKMAGCFYYCACRVPTGAGSTVLKCKLSYEVYFLGYCRMLFSLLSKMRFSRSISRYRASSIWFFFAFILRWPQGVGLDNLNVGFILWSFF